MGGAVCGARQIVIRVFPEDARVGCLKRHRSVANLLQHLAHGALANERRQPRRVLTGIEILQVVHVERGTQGKGGTRIVALAAARDVKAPLLERGEERGVVVFVEAEHGVVAGVGVQDDVVDVRQRSRVLNLKCEFGRGCGALPLGPQHLNTKAGGLEHGEQEQRQRRQIQDWCELRLAAPPPDPAPSENGDSDPEQGHIAMPRQAEPCEIASLQQAVDVSVAEEERCEERGENGRLVEILQQEIRQQVEQHHSRQRYQDGPQRGPGADLLNVVREQAQDRVQADEEGVDWEAADGAKPIGRPVFLGHSALSFPGESAN